MGMNQFQLKETLDYDSSSLKVTITTQEYGTTLKENLVCVANRDNPIFKHSGSLTIDNNGNLKISDNGSLSIVLNSGQEASNASAAVLLDNGNFVQREQISGRQLWQSFDYPTLGRGLYLWHGS